MPKIPFQDNSWLHGLALFLLIVISDANALRGHYQFDDYQVIVGYLPVHSLSSWAGDAMHGLRPFLKLSYTLNWISGLGVVGFHVVNELMHIVTTLLVYLLIRQIAMSCLIEQAGWMAFLSAVLFALHPVHTEAVTYLCGRSVLMMTMFSLASLLVYSKGNLSNSRIQLYGLSPLFFLLALMTKETAILLPLGLMLWDTCFMPRRTLLENFGKQWVHWVLFLMAMVYFLLNKRYWQILNFSANLHSIQTNLYTQIHAMAYLGTQWFWPFRMNIDPDLPIITHGSEVVWEGAALWFLFVIGIKQNGARPWLAFPIFWFLLQLLPIYILLPRLDIANDRELYLAAWGMGLPCMMVLMTVRFKYVLMVGLGSLLCIITILRNEDYFSETALWESTVSYSPKKARPYNNLGFAYAEKGENEKAKEAYLKALSIYPEYWLARNNLSNLKIGRNALQYTKTGREDFTKESN